MTRVFEKLPTRIIARLDVKKPNVVKGIHLEGLRIVGSPTELALKYQESGCDELLFIDCVASLYMRNTVFDVIESVAEKLRIPFTVGGGVKSLDDISALLHKGADKILINTGAVKNPNIISEAAYKYGSQCIVVSVEAKKISEEKWLVYVDNGRENTQVDVLTWVKRAEEMGAGEIIITSIDRDGTRKGFELNLCKSIVDLVKIPVIVSGGAGTVDHISEVMHYAAPSGVALGASLHYNLFSISNLKAHLNEQHFNIRPI